MVAKNTKKPEFLTSKTFVISNATNGKNLRPVIANCSAAIIFSKSLQKKIDGLKGNITENKQRRNGSLKRLILKPKLPKIEEKQEPTLETALERPSSNKHSSNESIAGNFSKPPTIKVRPTKISKTRANYNKNRGNSQTEKAPPAFMLL